MGEIALEEEHRGTLNIMIFLKINRSNISNRNLLFGAFL
jgi:hypothetical protein